MYLKCHSSRDWKYVPTRTETSNYARENFVEANGLIRQDTRNSYTRSCCVFEKFLEPPLFWALSTEIMQQSWAIFLFLLYSSLVQYLQNHAQADLLHHSNRQVRYCSSVSLMVRARVSSHVSSLRWKYILTASRRSWYTILLTLLTRYASKILSAVTLCRRGTVNNFCICRTRPSKTVR